MELAITTIKTIAQVPPSDSFEESLNLHWDESSETDRLYQIEDGKKVYLNSNYESYWPNGRLNGKGAYLNGFRVGFWQIWEESGYIAFHGVYSRKGKRFSKWRQYKSGVLYMIMDHGANWIQFDGYDMKGNLWHRSRIYNEWTDNEYCESLISQEPLYPWPDER